MLHATIRTRRSDVERGGPAAPGGECDVEWSAFPPWTDVQESMGMSGIVP